MLLEIDFTKFQSLMKISTDGAKHFVFDPVRRKNVSLGPEELLRQLVLRFLIDEKNYPIGRIRSEKGLKIGELRKRCDVLVFDQKGSPWLLIECKSPKIKLSFSVFEQVARYNLALKVPFLAVTNGLATFVCEMDFEKKAWQFLPDFPPT